MLLKIMKTFVLTCLAAVLLVSCSPGEEDINYFPQTPPEDITAMLHEMGLESCDDFIQTYLRPSGNDRNNKSRRITEALAYEGGLCVEQDLSHALKTYEDLHRNDFMQDDPLIVRMAMLYAYGPPKIRAPEKAGFYFRQAAIHTAVIEDSALRRNRLSHLAAPDNKVPVELDRSLTWLEDFLKKSEEERKALALDLKAQGYQDTEYLWDYLADLEEQNERNQKRLENSRTTLETLKEK